MSLEERTTFIPLAGEMAEIVGSPADAYFAGLDRAPNSLRFLETILASRVADGATCIDVGANIGLTSILMSRLVEPRAIFSIEPGPSAFGFLERNLDRNCTAPFRALNLAIGKSIGTARLLVTPDFLAGGHIVSADRAEAVEVPLSTLDAVIAEYAITSLDFIKIDVEGFEADVLEGAQRTLHELKPLIFMEINAWTLMAFQDVSPVRLLRRIREEFGRILYRRRGDKIDSVVSEAEMMRLLHYVIVEAGAVTDIAFSADPNRLEGNPEGLARRSSKLKRQPPRRARTLRNFGRFLRRK